MRRVLGGSEVREVVGFDPRTEHPTFLPVLGEMGSPYGLDGCNHDVSEKGNPEGLIPNQAMVFLVLNLMRQDVCVLLDGTNCGEVQGMNSRVGVLGSGSASSFQVTLSKSLPLSGLSVLC